jgi:hypothetical protein
MVPTLGCGAKHPRMEVRVATRRRRMVRAYSTERVKLRRYPPQWPPLVVGPVIVPEDFSELWLTQGPSQAS